MKQSLLRSSCALVVFFSLSLSLVSKGITDGDDGGRADGPSSSASSEPLPSSPSSEDFKALSKAVRANGKDIKSGLTWCATAVVWSSFILFCGVQCNQRDSSQPRSISLAPPSPEARSIEGSLDFPRIDDKTTAKLVISPQVDLDTAIGIVDAKTGHVEKIEIASPEAWKGIGFAERSRIISDYVEAALIEQKSNLSVQVGTPYAREVYAIISRDVAQSFYGPNYSGSSPDPGNRPTVEFDSKSIFKKK